ncbi:MAG: glycosyltransferase, partial [Mariprofundaceae bacterium]|nr:glycosyltransferase [Mariprofundaceae bacterium]
NRYVADWCLSHHKPYMITAHGCFNPIAMEISGWKKWLARHAYLRAALNGAICYQALSETEYRVMRAYGIRQPICIIGNGIQLPDMDALPAPDTCLPTDLMGRKTCLYLGRLHPIKGIDRLLRAWGKLRLSSDWQLVIAGGGEAAYRSELETIVHEEKCSNVHFVGVVTGDLKAAWLRHADLFVLASRSEAFPMALMEAFSYAMPALITSTCGFTEAVRAGAAMEVASTDDDVKDGLEQLLCLQPDQLDLMGEQALKFVAEHYDWRIICSQLEAVYSWMRSGSNKPDCLMLDDKHI